IYTGKPVYPVLRVIVQGIATPPEVLDIQLHTHAGIPVDLGSVPHDVIGDGTFLEVIDSGIPEEAGKPFPFQVKIGEVELFPFLYQGFILMQVVYRINGRGSNLPGNRIDHIRTTKVYEIRLFGPLFPSGWNDFIGGTVVKITLAAVIGT